MSTRVSIQSIGLALVLAAACSASEAPPSPGTYTVLFPSTAAAVATDTVQLLVFDVPPDTDRNVFCQTLIQGRRRGDLQKPVVEDPPVNICEMLAGKKPVVIAYGEKAVLAVAQRRAADFMVGCTIQTLGEGDAPLAISLSLLDTGIAVPDTQCTSVGDFCAIPPRCRAE